jgi:hypothetical protein
MDKINMTIVEWIEDQYRKSVDSFEFYTFKRMMINILKKGKEMEKEQIDKLKNEIILNSK